ncbi:DUF6470 family protein [Oceanobacillus kapialis]|uniref:DUF6470 family protein n=1 Tax=Oceanobacillus kapialis TaxID=481353 RepID=A0ABW5Q0H9_9BACI
MKLPQIRIQSQMAQTQIQQTRATQEIRQPKADLNIQQPAAEITMRTTPSKLKIDQTKAWEDMNLMHIFKRNDRFAQEGLSAVKEGMARRAQQGTELMKIENGGSPLTTQASTNAQRQMKSLGLTFIPSPFSVKTSYQPSELDISVKTNAPIIQAKANQPEITYHRGSLKTSMKQMPSLEINFVDLHSENG